MTYAIDERLIVLRNMIEDLIERQRISRFDTILFLIYPVLLAGMTGLTNAILQYRALQSISILGIDFMAILALGSLFILGVLGVGFFSFILAYLHDDLIGRIRACVYLVGMSGFALQLLFLVYVLPEYNVFAEIQKPDVLTSLVWLGLTLGTGGTWRSLWRASTSLSKQWITAWFERTAPRVSVAQGLFAADGDWRERQESPSLLGLKTGSLVICLAYGYMVIRLVQALGLQGAVVYHATVLIILLALICFLMSYRSLKGKVRRLMT
jgi:hypothetical protein